MNIAVIFPKDSEALFNQKSNRTFGGATVQLYQFAKELSTTENINLTGIINDFEGFENLEFRDYPLVKSFKNTDSLIKKITRFHSAVSETKPYVIIQRGLTIYSCLFALYCWIRRIKFVFMFAHDNEADGRYQRTNNNCILFFLLLRFSHLLICQSEYQKNRIHTKFHDKTIIKKTRIIKSGYEIEPANKTNKEYILWVGRLEKWKQPELFLDIANSIPDELFVMIAPEDPSDPTLAQRLKLKAKSIKNLKIIDFINFHEIDSYFKKAKLFINTSIKEGFPNTFIQSCKNLTPIISLSVNPDDFLEKYKTGFYCNNDLSYMKEIIKNFPDQREVYSEYQYNAYNYAKINHNIFTNSRELLAQIN